jgi:hypothetical protein
MSALKGVSPMPNAELEAMGKMAAIVEPLEPDARTRAVSWIVQHFGIEIGRVPFGKRTGAPDTPARAVPLDFDTLADLFHAARPRTDREKALVAAYWIQQSKGTAQFASQEVNSELKHLGFGVSNITDALSQLMNEKPSYVIQLKKSGSSKQARKTYKVTDAGNRKVEEMLSEQKE